MAAAVARSNLRNTTTFPSFADMPHETEQVRPGQHWCFLSEIESMDYLARLVLHVHDQAGRALPIAFYTDDSGALIHDSCRPGYTVAVLYAQRRDFMDGSSGVRVEELAHVKIIPHSLRTLRAASDLIVADDPRPRGCASCGETPHVGLSRCARCEKVYYCGKECQKTAWFDGHKVVCGAVGALAWFVEQDWENSRGALRF